MIRREAFQYLSFGFYIGFILSLTVLVLVFVGNMLSNESKPKFLSFDVPRFDPQTGEPLYEKEAIVRYDQKTGKPIYEKAKKIVGYNPNTGEPIYK